MLTCNPFALTSSPIDLQFLPSPLIKITDFGLARFIDPSNPLLTTRCGSEYYSAPEIIMAQPYDGRHTDAWACGVVLFALATRVLPFDADVSRYRDGDVTPAADDRMEQARFPRSRATKDTKRSYLLRIAKGEYHWPGEHPLRRSSSGASSRRSSIVSSDEGHGSHPPRYWGSPSPSNALSLSTSPPTSATGDPPPNWPSQPSPISPSNSVISGGGGNGGLASASTSPPDGAGESISYPNPQSLVSEGLKRIVGKLLVRDPRKRARIVDLWTDEWMRGPGAPLPPPEALLEDQTPMDEEPRGSEPDMMGEENADWVPTFHSHRRSASGKLILDKGDTIPIVARQEVVISP